LSDKEGAQMNQTKTLKKFYSVILLAMLSMVIYRLVNPTDRPENINGLSQMQAMSIENETIETPRYASGVHLTAGICALLLVGYLFWFMIRKFQNDSRAELNARKNSFYNISLATGRTEYDLFHKSAEGWSVSSDRIDQDFKRYMSDQIMPHYALDFVRKNQEQIDESLIVKKEIKPTSWSDWAIAMLVFPGSILLLYALMVLFDRY
jgi:predicted small integral membrane protein